MKFVILALLVLMGAVIAAPAPRPKDKVRPSLVGYWRMTTTLTARTTPDVLLVRLHQDGSAEAWTDGKHWIGKWGLTGDVFFFVVKWTSPEDETFCYDLGRTFAPGLTRTRNKDIILEPW